MSSGTVCSDREGLGVYIVPLRIDEEVLMDFNGVVRVYADF